MAASMNQYILEVIIYYVDPTVGIDGNKFIGGKERKRVKVTENEVQCFTNFCKILKQQSGIVDESIQRGLGKDVEIKISRISKTTEGVKNYGISTQDTWSLELEEILRGSSLQVFVLKKDIIFAKGSPIIRLVATDNTDEAPPQKRTYKRKKTLAKEEDLYLYKRLKNGEDVERNDRQKENLQKMNKAATELGNCSILNEYSIECGRCFKVLTVPCDRKPEKRVEYFKIKHWNLYCSSIVRKNEQKSQGKKDIANMKGAMQRWLTVKPSTSNSNGSEEVPATESDDDMDNLDNTPYDVDMESIVVMCDTIDSDLEVDTCDCHEKDFQNETEYEAKSPVNNMSSSRECVVQSSDFISDNNISDISESEAELDPEYIVFPVSLEPADEMCVKLNSLIRDGKIPQNKILYKFLNDVTSILIDPNHHYDSEVIEFFNTIKYLGGERTVNFLRGPMWYGTGTGGKKDPNDAKLNFGGPSSHARLKRSSGYTTESGIIKPWLTSMLQLATDDNEIIPFVESSNVKVIGFTMANDGTALKPSILYDDLQKVNVGLKQTTDINFVRRNPNPDADYLRQNVVTDADVTYISTIDNKISLPVAVTYKPKSGKTGADIKSQFLDEVSIVQTCLNCLQESQSHRHILTQESVSQCVSECDVCTATNTVCDTCLGKGHMSSNPALRACSRCVGKGVKCKRGIVLVITADCEQGNKTAFEMLISDRNAGLLKSQFSFVVLPDAVHVGKSLKASFANWPILLDMERSCLAILHTIRDANPDLRRILPRDAVTNKDRMDINCILHLTKSSVVTHLASTNSIVHTIIPDKYKISPCNKVGLYPHPISIVSADLGKLFVIDYSPTKSLSRLLEVRQHVPAEVKVIGTYDEARSLAYTDGSLYICEHNKRIRVHPKNVAKLNVKKLKKDALVLEARQRNLPTDGTVVVLQNRIAKNLQDIEKKYKERRLELDTVDIDDEFPPSCICSSSDQLLIVASDVKRKFVTVFISSDGVILKGKVKIITSYPNGVREIMSMTLLHNQIYAVYKGNPGGLLKIDLETGSAVNELYNDTPECSSISSVSVLGDNIIFTDSGSNQVKEIVESSVRVIAGSGQAGNNDGPCENASFSQLFAVCSELSNIFVCDAQTGCVKIITKVNGSVEFLTNLRLLYQAFSVHFKHQNVKRKSLEEAKQMVGTLSTYLHSTIRRVQVLLDTERQLNGPEGTISAKTLKSVDMISSELGVLQEFIRSVNPNTEINMLSCLTVCVENLHALGHFKYQIPTMLEHARNLGNTVYEGLKRSVVWAAYYYTHKSSYYPVPENDMPLSALNVMTHLKPVQLLSKDQESQMREWAMDYGKCVRQRSIRQQTTMYNTGTLPLNMYKNAPKTTSKIMLDEVERNAEVEEVVENPVIEQSIVEYDQVSEYDSDSDVDDDDVEVEREPISDTPACFNFIHGSVNYN